MKLEWKKEEKKTVNLFENFFWEMNFVIMILGTRTLNQCHGKYELGFLSLTEI